MDKICEHCGTTFTTRKKKQRFCSEACVRASRHKDYWCQHCGKRITGENAFRQKYCSRKCAFDAQAAVRPPKPIPVKISYERNCLWCGVAFSTPYPNKIYCSDDCCRNAGLKAKRDQWAEKYVPKTYVCKECNTEFTTECGDTHSVFCCQSCADKYDRRQEHQTERHKQSMREAKRRREKQLRDSFIENVSYDAIYQRDGGICQICGLPVHPAKGVDNNWDGTIDHIKPLSVGGKHSMANCQLAHRICNSLKHQQTEEFTVDWEKKSQENNYWRIKYEQYERLMSA